PEPVDSAPPACDCDTCKDLQKNGGDLPSPTECKKKDDPKCHDWIPAGTLDNPKEKDVSDAKANKATHFVKEFKTACGKFTCSYLPRFNKPDDGKMLHGMLCF